MVGLAGGAFSFSPCLLASDNLAVQPPMPETPIALAVQGALADIAGMESVGESLRLSSSLQPMALNPGVGGVFDPADQGLVLRRASLFIEPSVPDPVPVELPLRLSQMTIGPASDGRQPRWMTIQDTPSQLRPSRELSPQMPGAAGIGRPVPGSALFLGGANVDADSVLPGGAPAENPGSPTGLAGGAAKGASEPWTLGGLGWEIPPIRWGGGVGYSYQNSTSSTGSSSSSQGVFANMAAASYIYAPWFARVSGRLGLTTSASSSESSGALGGNGDQPKNTNVTGGGEINMFSSSRYPLRAYYDRSDSRVSGTIVNNDYVSNRFGISQSFRAEDGSSGGNFMLDRSSVSMTNGQRDEVTAVNGSYSQQIGIVQNNFNGRYSLGERTGTGDKVTLFGLNSSHVANISDTLNLGGTVNYSDSDIRVSNGLGVSSASRGRYMQLYGYGSWLPEFEDVEDLPLTLSGGLRYSGQETAFGGESFSAQSLGANLSALYRYSSNLSLSANGAVNQLVQSTGEAVLLTQLGSSVAYAGNPLSFGNFSYSWNTGANANWQGAAGAMPANTMLNGQLGHSLSRVFTFQPGQTIAFNASQSLGIVESQLVGAAKTLTNTGSVNFGLAAGERFSGSVSTMLSDVRTSGYLEQEYQVLNVGFYGQGQLSQLSSANINLMFNYSDQSYQAVDAFGFPITQNSQRWTLNGSAAYTHQRFAGVRGLRYNMIFAADTRQRDERLFGNVNGEVNPARFSLTNRLEYRLGLLDFRLSLITNQMAGQKNALLFFQVSRQIGSY